MVCPTAHAANANCSAASAFSLNADLERENLPEAEQVLQDLRPNCSRKVSTRRLRPPATGRHRPPGLGRAGQQRLADYYWSAAGDYDNGHFGDPAKRIKAVSLAQTNQAMRQLFKQPGYWRIEKPLLSDDVLSWIGAGVLGLIAIVLIGVRVYRKRIA
jgi:hypothetical protein